MSAWNNVPKPRESSVIGFTGGEPIGLLLALTKSIPVSSLTSGWTDITKPSTANWTPVSKPSTQTWVGVAKPTT